MKMKRLCNKVVGIFIVLLFHQNFCAGRMAETFFKMYFSCEFLATEKKSLYQKLCWRVFNKEPSSPNSISERLSTNLGKIWWEGRGGLGVNNTLKNVKSSYWFKSFQREDGSLQRVLSSTQESNLIVYSFLVFFYPFQKSPQHDLRK